MQKNKVFILLPDGIGLRNFAYSKFYEMGAQYNAEVVFWNNTNFSLSVLGFDEVKIEKTKNNPLTEIYKNAKTQAELNCSIKKENDKVYDSYRFAFSYQNIKAIVKSVSVHIVTLRYSSSNGLRFLRGKLISEERKTAAYNQAKDTLLAQNPTMVFCTNQRHTSSIAPLLAAQDLGIPTATFIFSWDNLPKATLVVEPDYYFVWSNHMKLELLQYYPDIKDEQIFITGTPQFESHFDASRLLPRTTFFKNHGLDLAKKYICYSGDDVTTSPDDATYLDDVAQAVAALNAKGNAIGILFRRCPVDFSDRYDAVIKKYKDIIVPVAPQWEKIGADWSTILPTNNDVTLQMNTIYHTEMVVNLGSSMVFDYVAHKKPCAYINYDIPKPKDKNWSVKKIYKFVHFRSMPHKNAVVWLNTKQEIAAKLEQTLATAATVPWAQKWFEKINQHPPQEASERIWNAITKIIQNKND
ncbi:UDP-glycosyltransferase [Flavobacterium psychrophilum]